MDSRADPDAGAGPVADDSAPFDDGVFGRQPGSRDYRSYGTSGRLQHQPRIAARIVDRRAEDMARECSMAPRRKRSKWNRLRMRLKRASTTSSHARRRRPGKPADRRPGARPAATRHTSAINVPSPVVRQLGDRCPGTIEDWRDLRAAFGHHGRGHQLHRNDCCSNSQRSRASTICRA